jgi:hypothetical protein
MTQPGVFLARAGVLACLALACAHPPPRGPVAATKPGAPLKSCGEAPAPHLAELCAMHEPTLSELGPETYRFTWIRHQHNPVAVRVSRAGRDGIAVVAVQADTHDPSNARRHEFNVTVDAWNTLLAHLQAADFWNMAGDPEDDERGLDGADWIIEGRRANIYHSVIRWEPKIGPFRDACDDFIKISGLSFPAEIR